MRTCSKRGTFAKACHLSYTFTNTSKQQRDLRETEHARPHRHRLQHATSPTNISQRLNIVEVPAVVNFGQESYLYKVELSLEEFYRRLAAPTGCRRPRSRRRRQFAEAYQRAADEGADEIIAVTVSSRASGTYNSAVIAAEQAPVPVHVWDTLHVSMAAGWQAIAAAEMVRDGLVAAEAILARLAAIRGRRRTWLSRRPT